jgi:HAMP domain-containing protein
MQFAIDNAVALSAIALGVLVLAGLAVLGIAGFRLWRTLTRVKRRIAAASDALLAEADRLQQSLAALPDRQAEVQEAVASLQRRAAALSVLAASAGEAVQVLRAPLRFVGR